MIRKKRINLSELHVYRHHVFVKYRSNRITSNVLHFELILAFVSRSPISTYIFFQHLQKMKEPSVILLQGKMYREPCKLCEQPRLQIGTAILAVYSGVPFASLMENLCFWSYFVWQLKLQVFLIKMSKQVSTFKKLGTHSIFVHKF